MEPDTEQNLGRVVAGKTGTTSDHRCLVDGFTPNIITGVWVGFDNHRPIGPPGNGARAALDLAVIHEGSCQKYAGGGIPIRQA